MKSYLILALLIGAALADPAADPAAKPKAEPEADAKPDAKAKPKPKAQYGHHGHHASIYGGYGSSGHTASLTPYGPPPQPLHYEPPPLHYKPEPEPIYVQETYPKQNCSVTDEAVRAEICIPDFQTKCEEDNLMSKRLENGEFCYDVTRTECKQVEITEEVEICSFSYDRKEQTATAKTVEVEFKQECEKQMVTVCQPATYPAPAPAYGQNPYGGYGPPPPQEYGVYQQCKEVAQETCYNVPQVVQKEMEVTMGFPQAKRACEMHVVTIPEIQCEDIVESKCQDMPHITETPESIERCEVVVGEPKCSEVEMVLPKQICQDIIYGYAEEPKYDHYEPAYHAPQPQYGHHGHHGQVDRTVAGNGVGGPGAGGNPAPLQERMAPVAAADTQPRAFAKRYKRKRL